MNAANLDKNTGSDSVMQWNLVVLSNNQEFSLTYKNTLTNLNIGEVKLNSFVHFDEEAFLNSIQCMDFRTIVHLDCSDKSVSWLTDLIKIIRNSENCKYAFITSWYNKNWDKVPTELISYDGINEIRTTKNLTEEKIHHVIFSNIQNQKQIIELINLKASLEEKIEERTASLTRLNKKLQAAIIQNSNINTKLHQQKIQIEKQNTEINAQNEDLEKAFKKSSKQSIKLHKVLMENEEQRHQLEKALDEIRVNNNNLRLKNEEIIAQNEHIDQQREEIQSQRDMAVKQHDLIQEQQEEITENITYARRIQNAMLTPEKMLKQLIPDHFVLNKPKDIVSGDFFYVTQNLNYTILAVADCTGHGISGAMMSMLGIAFLNEIVNNNGVVRSAEILQQLRDRIIISLHQEYSHDISFSRDGMDIAVAVIDIVENKLEYSGANNPMYVIRNKELIELAPDRMPIGIHEFFEESFTSQFFDLQKNDTLYLFSDGYADQFGGTKGRKLKYKKFKEILLNANSIPLNEQSNFLNSEFENWRGEWEQIDDVLIMGYKFLD